MTFIRLFQVHLISLFTLLSGIVVLVVLSSPASATADEKFFDMGNLTISDNPLINTGWQIYQVKCAVCHGAGGLGDGPMMDILIMKPADLTKISKRYGGDFPFQAIYEKIDGRDAPLAHGTREMPIWGEEFAKEAAGISKETLTNARIKALLTYLKSIQQ